VCSESGAGPKVGGGFYQNLNGNYDPVTMDMWMMRTWGRLTGELVGAESEVQAKQLAGLTAALKAEGKSAPRSPERMRALADQIVDAHVKDFAKNRALYDSGKRKVHADQGG
jgi:hypothetical protein